MDVECGHTVLGMGQHDGEPNLIINRRGIPQNPEVGTRSPKPEILKIVLGRSQNPSFSSYGQIRRSCRIPKSVEPRKERLLRVGDIQHIEGHVGRPICVEEKIRRHKGESSSPMFPVQREGTEFLRAQRVPHIEDIHRIFQSDEDERIPGRHTEGWIGIRRQQDRGRRI